MALKNCRHSMGYTQKDMASAMGLPLRTYEDLESGRTPTRPIHIMAMKWAMVEALASRSAHPRIGITWDEADLLVQTVRVMVDI